MIRHDDETATFKVLLICRANICRSPTAELLLSRWLASSSIATYVDVSSAGIVAVEGQPWCEVAAAKVGKGTDGQEMKERHRSRQVDLAMVERADLVLTAAREHRGAIVQLLPSATVRTFTLKEAAVLAAAVDKELTRVASGQPAPSADLEEDFTIASAPPGASPRELLQWLTSEMHNARGLVRLPESSSNRSGWRRRRTDVDGIDIPDSHGAERIRHHTSSLKEAVESWAMAAEAAVRQHGGRVG